jgi:hypothetical protein
MKEPASKAMVAALILNVVELDLQRDNYCAEDGVAARGWVDMLRRENNHGEIILIVLA